MSNNFESLCNAIIKQASIDYIWASMTLELYKNNPQSEEYKKADEMLDSCIEFFESDWFKYIAPENYDVMKLMDLLDRKTNKLIAKKLKK